MAKTTSRLFIIDGNLDWVNRLFSHMDPAVEVAYLRPFSASYFLTRQRADLPKLFQLKELRKNQWELLTAYPGWSRFPKLSAQAISLSIKKLTWQLGPPTAVVYTFPFYQLVRPKLKIANDAYFATDPFQYYQWGSAWTTDLENELIRSCRKVITVSRSMSEDFEKRGASKAEYCPNAVSSSWIETLSGPLPPRPKDLVDLQGEFIVGCIGQIGKGYDWDLIVKLSDSLPEMKFVFIGPVVESDAALDSGMKRALAKQNVLWLGPKKHEELPNYLRHFDVCTVPMVVNDHNHRRSFLRLYDYLASDKPILCPDLREAREHVPHLEVSNDAEYWVRILRAVRDGSYRVDLASRRKYIWENTWQKRAERMRVILGV